MVSTKHWLNDTDKGSNEKKYTCPSVTVHHKPHTELVWDWTGASVATRLATNRRSHARPVDTNQKWLYIPIQCPSISHRTPFLEISQTLPSLSQQEQSVMSKEHWWNDTDRDKPKNSKKKTCPIATLYATNLTSNDLGSNPGLRVKKQMTTRLSHWTAWQTNVKAFFLSNASWFPKEYWKTNISLKCTLDCLPHSKHSTSRLQNHSV
jgi:hypothetical protein